jgi:hypothetical protein
VAQVDDARMHLQQHTTRLNVTFTGLQGHTVSRWRDTSNIS